MATEVENRVVEMRFDNSQFESGVKTSLSTIERLKRALNFKDTGKSLSDISTKATISGLESVDKSLKTISKRFTTLGVIGTTALQNITNQALHLGRRLVNVVSQPLVQGGINRAMNIAQAQFQIKGLKQDWNAIKDIVNEVVTDTAFGFDEAAKAAAQLGASGIEAGEKLETALKGIAGTAAMTNSGFTDIADIFTTVAGQGKLMSYQLNQLSFRGLNAAAELGKAMGKSEAEIREMVTKGKISFEMFSEAMYNAFGAHAKEANETFTGALANMKAAFARIGADFATPAMESLRPVFLAIKEKVKEIHGTMGPLIATATEAMKRLSKYAVEFIGNIKVTSLTKTFETISNIISGLGGIIIRVKDKIRSMIPDGVVKKINVIRDAINSWSKKFKEKWGIGIDSKALEKTAEAAKKVTKPLYDIEKLAARVINGDFGNGKKRIDELHAIDVSYSKVQNRVNELLGSNKRHKESAEDIAAEQRRIEKETAKAAEASKILAKNNKKALTPLSKFERILNGIKAAVEIAANAFDAFYTIILKPAAKAMLALLLEYGARLGDTLVSISKYVKRFNPFHTILRRIRDGFIGIITTASKIWSALGGFETIKNVFFTIVGVISKVVSGIKTFYRILLKPAITTVFTTLISVIKKVRTKISELGQESKKLKPFGDVLQSIKDHLLDIVDRIKKVKDAVAGFEPLQKFIELIANALSKATAFIKGLIDKFVEIGNTIKNLPGVVRLVETLGKLGETLKTFALDKLDKISGFFKKFNGVKIDFSGLSGLSGIGDIGYGAIDALADKLSDIIELLMKCSGYAGDFLASFGTKAVDSVKKLTDYFTKLKDGISGAKDQADSSTNSIKNFFSTIVKNVGTIFDNIKKSGHNVIQGFIDTILNIDLSKASKLVQLVSTIYIVKHVVELIKSVKGTVDSVGSVPKKLAGVFASMSSAIDKYAETLNTSTIDVLATSIMKIAGAMVLLSGIPSEQLVHISMQIVLIILALSALMRSVTGFTHANSELTGVAQSVKSFFTSFIGIFQKAAALVSVGLVFLSLAAGVAILGKIFMDLAAMKADADAAMAALGIITLFIFELSAAVGTLILIAGLTKGKLSVGTALAFVGIAVAVKILAGVAQDIATNFEPDELKQGLIGVTVLMAIMTLMSRFARPKGMLQLAAGMVIMSVAIWTLVPALFVLSKLTNLGGAIGGLAASLTVLAVAAFAFSNKKLQEGALYVVGISTALLIFAAAMRVFAPAAESLKPALIALAALTAFLIVGAVIGSALMPFAAGLLVVAAAFVAFGASVVLFGEGVKLLGEGLTLLGDGLNQFVNRFIDTLTDISQRKDEAKQGIADAIKAMAEGVNESIPQIIIAASSLMMAFAQAIIKSAPYVIAAVTTLSSALLSSVILGIAGIAGVAIKGLVLALYSLAKAIVDNAEPLFQAQKAVMKALTYAVLVGIYSMFEDIAKIFGVDGIIHDKLDKMKESLKSEFTYEEGKSITQPFAQGATDGSKEGLQNLTSPSQGPFAGIASSIAGMGDKIAEEVKGTKDKATDAADGGAKDIMDSFMGDGFDTKKIYSEFEKYGLSAPEGFVNGGLSGSDDVNKMMENMMNGDVIDPTKNILDINSPSKVFMGIGQSVVEGLSEGIEQNKSKVTSPLNKIIKQLSGSVEGKDKGFASAGKSMINSLVSALKSGSKHVADVLNAMIKGCISAVTSHNSTMRSSGTTLINNLKAGMESVTSIKSSIRSVMSGAKSTLKSYNDSFYSVGKNLMEGLKDGIDSKAKEIAESAAAIVRAAIAAARSEADINSPSKEFMFIGEAFGEGIIVGVKKLSNKTAKSTAEMVSNSITNSKDALSDLAGLLDIDTQPVIRPVVDASGVYATASDIESLFGDTELGVNGNIGAITRMMQNRQNGSDNSDVVMAINRLRTGLESAPRNTYQFGNVTYGDDSSVSTAVGSLIRAIKMEGRM